MPQSKENLKNPRFWDYLNKGYVAISNPDLVCPLSPSQRMAIIRWSKTLNTYRYSPDKLLPKPISEHKLNTRTWTVSFRADQRATKVLRRGRKTTLSLASMDDNLMDDENAPNRQKRCSQSSVFLTDLQTIANIYREKYYNLDSPGNCWHFSSPSSSRPSIFKQNAKLNATRF